MDYFAIGEDKSLKNVDDLVGTPQWTYAGMLPATSGANSFTIPTGTNPKELYITMMYEQMEESILIPDIAMTHGQVYTDQTTYSTWLLGTTNRVSKLYIRRTAQNGDYGYRIEDQSATRKNMYVYYR